MKHYLSFHEYSYLLLFIFWFISFGEQFLTRKTQWNQFTYKWRRRKINRRTKYSMENVDELCLPRALGQLKAKKKKDEKNDKDFSFVEVETRFLFFSIETKKRYLVFVLWSGPVHFIPNLIWFMNGRKRFTNDNIHTLWTILSQQFHIDAMRPIHFVRIFLYFQFFAGFACLFRVFALISSWPRVPNSIECYVERSMDFQNWTADGEWRFYFHMLWLSNWNPNTHILFFGNILLLP